MNRDPIFSNESALAKEAIKLLQQSIQHKTVNPPGNELELAEYYQKYLESQDLPEVHSDIIEVAPQRGNLIVTIAGTEADSRPIWAFCSHLDVVSASNEDDWCYPPFEGRLVKGEKDTFIWGRGAMDMKYVGVAMLCAFVHNIKQGWRPKSTVRLIFESDEEISGYNGIVPLIKNHWEKIQLDYFITEGGGYRLPIKSDYCISVAEKGKLILKLVAKGDTGHGSAPGKYENYAIFRLTRFLRRLEKYRTPIIISEEYKNMINALSLPWLVKKLLTSKRLVRFTLGLADSFSNLSLKEKFGGFISPTISPTIIRGGEKENVFSSEAHIIMDIRIPLGQTKKDILKLIEDIAGRSLMEHLRFEVLDYVQPTSSSSTTDGYETLRSVLREMNPKANLVPIILPAGTDGRRIREHGEIAYGFCLSEIDEELDLNSIINMPHATDERVSVTNLMLATEYYARLFQKL